MRVALGTLAVLLLVYLGICLLLFARQRDLIYFPGYTHVDAAETDFALASGDVQLRGWIVNPGQPDALLYFGGNAESIGASRDDFRRWFPQRSVYLLAYRGYGASDGEPSQAALLGDALALYDHVLAQHGDDVSIALVGRSLGSGVASHVAAHRPVMRLALVTPFDSLASVGRIHYPWLPVRWLMRERYDAADALASYRGDVLVVRGGGDTIVPADATDALISALPRPPQVLMIDDAGHNDISLYPEYGQALSEFMR